MAKLPFFIIIFLLSCLNNLLVPFAIYFRKYGSGAHPEKKRFGGGACNAWGVIMAGFLAGAINVIALNLIWEIHPIVLWRDVAIVFLFGVLSTVSAHVWMSLKQWQVWIMPRPWQWNAAGYWHMVSMTLQMGFLYYPLLLVLKNTSLLHDRSVQLSLLSSFLLGLVFLLCFHVGQRGLRIGRFCIDNKPW